MCCSEAVCEASVRLSVSCVIRVPSDQASRREGLSAHIQLAFAASISRETNKEGRLDNVNDKG